MSVINVILSGGVGSRLWPLSRKSRPKQYIPLFDDRTLFEMCIDRNVPVVDKLMVVGSVDNFELSRADFAKCQVKDYLEIIEAAPRNTAASIAFAAFAVEPDDLLFVTPSDHIISGEASYKDAVRKSIELAEKGYIVTFGAVPTRPETGYGYIEFDSDSNVLSFKEKPDLQTATEYVAKKTYLWNSGMFCFKASVYLEELEKYAPEIFRAAQKAMDKIDANFLPSRETMEIPSVSVDFAVMEHSKKIKVLPFDFDWSDLGSFGSIWEYMEKKSAGSFDKNLVLGSKKHVEFVGVENLILVETDDAIVVMSKDRSQDVKGIYERLEKEHPHLLL